MKLSSHLNYFTSSIDYWRHHARDLWRVSTSNINDSNIPKELPNYFLDRHAYLLFRSNKENIPLSVDDLLVLSPSFLDKISQWHSKIEKKRTPIYSLSNFIPDINDQFKKQNTRLNLLNQWKLFLDTFGIYFPNHLFQIDQQDTWLSFFKKSVHYPLRLPAILGPSFFDRLSDEYKAKVLENFHYDQLWELYAFILQVHEDVHSFQKGEPMLNEVMLSYLWCSFLDKHHYWYWQEKEKNGESFNRERDWIRKIYLTNEQIQLLYQDNFIGISTIFKCEFAYDLICEGAWLFDHKYYKYNQYLDFIVWCFENREKDNLLSLSKHKWRTIC